MLLTALRRTSAAAAVTAAGCAAYHGLVEDVRRLPAYAWCVEALAMPLLRRCDAEQAHGAAIQAAALGLSPRASAAPLPSALATAACGLRFRSPIGLAAGFDKQAEAMAPLLEAGFGFVEVGTVTPQPQAGNPLPRMFRLEGDAAVINRFGFNSDGGAVVAARLARYWGALSRGGIEPGDCSSTSSTSSSASSAQPRGLVGVNLGKNKEGVAEADYVAGVLGLAPFADYLTINISSPNTPGLRALQGREQLGALLHAVKRARDSIAWGVAPLQREPVDVAMAQPQAVLARALVSRRARPPPLFVKIAPDLTEADLGDIAAVVAASGIDGIIVSNTTLARPASLSAAPEVVAQAGGLSGAPLFHPSTRVLARMYVLTGGAVPLIGVGGVASAEQAYDKIKAGATLVQIYTALAYSSPALIPRINAGLAELLAKDGHTSVAQAVGKEAVSKWGGGTPLASS